MKTWKRNAIVAAVLALVCGGIYLNWRYETNEQVDLVSTLNQEKILDDAKLVIRQESQNPDLEALAQEGQASAEDAESVFSAMRLSRQQSRDSVVHLLQETISYAGEGENISSSAAKMENIVSMALAEASIESLVRSKGFTECVAYMTEEGIDLAVASKGLSESDVALLTDLVLSQTDYELPQIRIIEVK